MRLPAGSAFRVRTFRAQRQALRDAEAVLLVDDGQAERLEDHAFLEQRMRAHRHAGRARGDVRRRRRALLLFLAAREPGEPHPQRREPFGEFAVMLLGQDFGRRHHRGLQAVFHRAQRRQRRHHRLAAADIALQQAVHGMDLGEVALDLGPGAHLRAREAKRQALEQARGQRAGCL